MSASDMMTNKWGKDVVDSGFVQVPNHLVMANKFLNDDRKITPTEFLVIMQLLQAWWRADKLPFPSKATLSERTGLSSRQVQRALSGLEEKKFIERKARMLKKGRGSNIYDLSGIVNFVNEVVMNYPDALKSKREERQKDKEPQPVMAGAPETADGSAA